MFAMASKRLRACQLLQVIILGTKPFCYRWRCMMKIKIANKNGNSNIIGINS